MRYIIIVIPFNKRTPIGTDFRLIAYCIAFFKKLVSSDVYVFDNDIGECIYSSQVHKNQKRTIKGVMLSSESD